MHVLNDSIVLNEIIFPKKIKNFNYLTALLTREKRLKKVVNARIFV